MFEFLQSEFFLEALGYGICVALGGGAYAIKARPFIKAAKFLVENIDQELFDKAPSEERKSIVKVKKKND